MRESGTSFIEADEPITTLKEDLLNRAPIVQTLARLAVVDHLHVIALEGPFGDGKTSVLRLLGEALTSDHSDFKETSVASFSPWLAGNSENLPANLMKAIVRAIQKKYYAPRLRQNSLKYVRSSPK
jgi:replication-associated recombination protein RarA